MRHDDPHISGQRHRDAYLRSETHARESAPPTHRNAVADPSYSEKLEIAAKERAYKQDQERRTAAKECEPYSMAVWDFAGELQANFFTRREIACRLQDFLNRENSTSEDVRTEDAESYDRIKAFADTGRKYSDERSTEFLKRKVAEQQPVDLLGQLEARLDALELRYMNRAREF